MQWCVACVEETLYLCAVVELCGGRFVVGVLAEARRFWSLWVGQTPCYQPVWTGVRLVLTFWCPSWTCVVSYSLPQLVIAESNPGLDGHKLAASLCKVPSIGVTLIPDSNIYALMARVNKVGLCGSRDLL
jgi:hypothetical protein